MNQRWFERRASFRTGVIRTADYEVEELTGDGVARDFIAKHHYSDSYPVARRRYGLRCHGELVGVAVYSHPVNDRVLDIFDGPGIELGRFVLLDRVPGNGESWFIARTFELLRGEFPGVLAHSDPLHGHVGTIYQATNARYLGRTTPRTLRVLPDGRVFHSRACQKVRRLERGWIYAARQLQIHGADEVWLDRPVSWVNHWVGLLTRAVKHPGNYRYAWGTSLPGLAYPKKGMP